MQSNLTNGGGPAADLVALTYDAIVAGEGPQALVDVLGSMVDRPMGISDRTMGDAHLGGTAIELRQYWTGLPTSFERDYVAEFHKSDPWLPFAGATEIDRLHDGVEFVAQNQLERTPFYQDLCRPFGFGGITAGIIHRSRDRLITVGAMHPKGDRASESFHALVGPLMPHFRRAFELRARMDDDVGRDWIARFVDPAFMIDTFGVIRSANDLGSALLAGDGLPILLSSQRARLRAIVEACLERGPTEVVCSPGGGSRVVLLFDRAPGHARRVLARVLRASEPADSSSLPSTLQRAYGLTPAEIDLALELVAGRTPKEAAANLSIEISTVRTQLRRLFEKTGTDRQATFLRLLERIGSLRRG